LATILIVDDRSSNREFLATLLGYVGHRALEAKNGAEALELLGEEGAALVITDILMPVMDGFELSQKLRADPRWSGIPIIFHTATFSEPEAQRLARSCGVRTVLPKPCEPQQVLDAVSSALGTPVHVAQAASAGPSDDSLTLYVEDLEAVRRSLESIAANAEGELDPESMRRLSQRFAKNAADLQRIGSRVTALVEVGLELMPERDPARLVKLFFGACCEVVEAQYAAIGVLDEAGGLRHVHARNLEPALLRDNFGPLVAKIMAQKRPVRLNAPAAGASLIGLARGHPPARSFLGVPIATRQRLFGWLYFAGRRGPEEFDNEDERLASILAGKLAVLYENAMLYDEVQRHAADLRIEAAERKRAEVALQRFRLALDNSADVILIIDRAAMLHVDVNQTACRLLGYSREELLTMGPADILPVSRGELEKTYDELIAGASPLSGMKSYYRCKDGSHLPFESTRHVLRSGDAWLIAAVSRDIRDRIAAEEALRQSEAGLRRAQQMAKIAHVITAPDGSFESWSETLPQLAGFEAERLPRTTREWLEIVHLEDRPLFRSAAIEAGERGEAQEIEYRLCRGDGATIHVRQAKEPLGAAGGGLRARWFNTLQDITEQKQAAERIERLNRVYAVLSGINSLIVRQPARDELFREACRIAVEQGNFGIAWIGEVDLEAMEARPIAWAGVDADMGMQKISARDEPPGSESLLGRVLLTREAAFSNDMTADSIPGRPRREEAVRRGYRSVMVLPLVVQDKIVAVLALFSKERGFFDDEELKLLRELAGDISFGLDHLDKAEKLDYLAYHDTLTGLANRSMIHERLEQTIEMARREQGRAALVVLDVERFKTINDTFGRQAGDGLLRQLAERMKGRVRDVRWLARTGADHFAVIVPDVTTDEELARRNEQRIRDIFGTPFRVGESELRVAAKLGIAMFPEDGADADALFRNAESALKKAKESGERYLFYTEQMTERVAERLSLENKLREALEKDQFVLHYQPKVRADSRKIVGVEALIRWQSADGLVPPVKFIPLLEETGLIREVGAWALRRAVLDHRHWLRMGIQAPRIAVNVSPVQLRQQDFVEVVQEIVAQGANPPGIDLEITESLIMEDVQGNIRKLKAIRDLGLSVAIDDFGTGYSSLAYLARFPVETLKVDRSFITAMLSDPNTMTLVQTMISLAHSLRLKVVAEGVETEEQARMLGLLRCDELQGYLISRPVPLEELTPRLRTPEGRW
jgi:diguanylate cyclase (GGDEF)-like protein/PAS domain S-box-containing protein